MIGRIGIILVAVVVLAGCRQKENPQAKDTTAMNDASSAAASPAEQPQAQAQAQSPRQAPQAAGPRRTMDSEAYPLEGLTWIKGGPVTIKPGNVYVVEFWATWCGPCKVSIPHLTELQKKYKDEGVVFVGVSDEPPEVTTPFVKEMGDKMDYNVASDTKGGVYRGYMEVFRQEGIPTAFVVGSTGKVVWFGHPMTDEFVQAIDKAIAAKPKALAQN